MAEDPEEAPGLAARVAALEARQAEAEARQAEEADHLRGRVA